MNLPKRSKAEQSAQQPRKSFKEGFKASFRTRSLRAGGYSVLAVAIVLAIIIAINIFVSALPSTLTQYDTSAQQLFTLSSQTKNIAGGLEDDVTIYWICQSGKEDAYMEILLDRYTVLSDHISVVKRDPDVYPSFASNYTDSDTINNNSLVVVCGDRYRYVDYYDIYVYDYTYYYYTGEYDVNFDGESALTSAIDYVTSEDLPKIYTLTGHGESALTDTYADAVDAENIETGSISLIELLEADEDGELDTDIIPEDADIILINNPTTDISDGELTVLLAWLQNGGNLILVTSPVGSDGQNSYDERPKLDELMAYYGMSEAEGIVLEGSSTNYYQYPYMLLPEYGTHDIVNPISEEGLYVLAAIAHGITVNDDLRDGLSVTQLLMTSSSAFSKLDGYYLATYEKENGDIDGAFALAAIAEETNNNGSSTSVVWLSTCYLLDENYDVGGNQDLFLNCLNYMAGDEDSISIHAKSLISDSLVMDSGTANFLGILVIAVLPIICLAVGIVIWFRRRNR